MEKQYLDAIKRLVRYNLNSEETHFWESCECEGSQDFDDDIKKCTCVRNKNHIYRSVMLLDLAIKYEVLK